MMRTPASCVSITMRLDLVDPVGDLRMQLHRALHRGLRVELGREADLEQDVLHHVAAERPLELERLALERDVVEAPGLRRSTPTDSRRTPFDRVQRVRHRTAAGIAGRPALARAGVRRVAIGAQRAVVDPAVRNGR